MTLEGIYRIGDSPATENLTPGKNVYGERLVSEEGRELRLWNPRRSKLAAAILNDLAEIPIKRNSHVLYLGAATGTTASHISDITVEGIVYCVEFSQRSFRELVENTKDRKNMIPILADARVPESYKALVGRCDVIYQDVAQAEQAQILLQNAGMFSKEGGHIMLAIKARSIDSARGPKEVIAQEIAKLKVIKITEVIDLSPYEKDHVMVIGIYKGK